MSLRRVSLTAIAYENALFAHAESLDVTQNLVVLEQWSVSEVVTKLRSLDLTDES